MASTEVPGTNPHERAARLEKARHLIEAIDAHLVSEDIVPHDDPVLVLDCLNSWTELHWRQAAKEASKRVGKTVNPPSATTVKLILDIYASRVPKRDEDSGVFDRF